MIEQIKQDLQQKMAIRYDAEFAQMVDFIQQAYELGVSDGTKITKTEMLRFLQGENK